MGGAFAMIGVIGPEDSVALVSKIAKAMGVSERLVTRTYRHMQEAAELARDLDETCSVVLFTGIVPYLAGSFELAKAEAQYISHSGADLYRCLAHVIREGGGRMPVVSTDSIDPATVIAAFSDLGLPQPLPHSPQAMDDSDPGAGVGRALAFHRAAISNGQCEAVLTCLSELYETLRAEGVRVWRIEHMPQTVEDALQRALLTDELNRARTQQFVAVQFEIDPAELGTLDVYQREEIRLRVHQELLRRSAEHGAQLTALAGGAFSLSISQHTFDSGELAILERLQTLDGLDVGATIRVSAGMGSSLRVAEQRAAEANRSGCTSETPEA